MKNLDYYKKKFYLLYEFCNEKEKEISFEDIYVNGKLFTAEEQRKLPSFWDYGKNIFETACESNNLKMLSNIDRSIDERLRGLKPIEYRNEVFEMLKNELGNDYEPMYDKIIAKVQKRGVIKSDKEFDAILARVEDIFQDPVKELEVIKLNKLLAEYESNKK
jgi:hypothetical protein